MVKLDAFDVAKLLSKYWKTVEEHLTLLSSDQKFAYYRHQGLNLIEY